MATKLNCVVVEVDDDCSIDCLEEEIKLAIDNHIAELTKTMQYYFERGDKQQAQGICGKLKVLMSYKTRYERS